LQGVLDKLQVLKDKYDGSVAEKNALFEEADMLENKLTRAGQLVEGLSGERVRWSASIGNYMEDLENAIGDSLLASGYRSYAGPFDTTYREDLNALWAAAVKENTLPGTKEFNFCDFLSNPVDVRQWQIDGPCA